MVSPQSIERALSHPSNLPEPPQAYSILDLSDMSDTRHTPHTLSKYFKILASISNRSLWSLWYLFSNKLKGFFQSDSRATFMFLEGSRS